MSQPCQDPNDAALHSIYQSMFRRSGTRKTGHSCTDLLLDHLVYLIMCNIQEPGNKAAVTAYNSLLTCSHTPAFNTFNFLSVTLSLTLPPLFVTSQPDTPLLLLPLGFFFSPPQHTSLLSPVVYPSVPQASRRECRRATPAISTNHCDLSCTRGVAVMGPAHVSPRLCVERHSKFSSQAEISLHQSETISPVRRPGGLQSGKC